MQLAHATPKEQDLFRQEAIIAAAGSQFGDPLETYWRGTGRFILVTFLILGALVTLLVVTEYAPFYRVPGFIDVPDGLVRIGAPADGRIVQIPIEEGSLVHAGDVLAVLNQDQLSVDGTSRSLAVREGIANEQATLAKEIAAATEEAKSQFAMTTSEITGLQSERLALLADLQSGDRLLNSLHGQYQQIAAAAEHGNMSKLDAARKLDEALSQESHLATSRAALARVTRDMDVASKSAQVKREQLQQLIETRHRESEALARASLGAAADAEQVIRAPLAGFVSSALISRGQTVVSGQPLFHLLPGDKPMVLHLLIPPRAAGTAQSGMHVRVAFEAYPREKYGEFEARLDRISDSPVLPGELVSFVTATAPAYLATATLVMTGTQTNLLRLKPGMLAEAFIPIEKRRAIEWLFDPLIRGFNSSPGTSANGLKPALYINAPSRSNPPGKQ